MRCLPVRGTQPPSLSRTGAPAVLWRRARAQIQLLDGVTETIHIRDVIRPNDTKLVKYALLHSTAQHTRMHTRAQRVQSWRTRAGRARGRWPCLVVLGLGAPRALAQGRRGCVHQAG